MEIYTVNARCGLFVAHAYPLYYAARILSLARHIMLALFDRKSLDGVAQQCAG